MTSWKVARRRGATEAGRVEDHVQTGVGATKHLRRDLGGATAPRRAAATQAGVPKRLSDRVRRGVAVKLVATRKTERGQPCNRSGQEKSIYPLGPIPYRSGARPSGQRTRP